VDDLLAMKSEDVELVVRAISFQDFPPMWSWSTNVTDRQTTHDSNTALCTKVHRTVKMRPCGDADVQRVWVRIRVLGFRVRVSSKH